MHLDFNGDKLKIAEDINEDTYKKISVESFGIMMLNNMKKTSINFLNQKRKPQELIEFKIKNTKGGLGYEEEEKKIKDGKIQTFSFYGKSIFIEKGEFKGHKGKILLTGKYETFNQLIEENDYILIELDINGQKHEIKNSYIKLINEANETEEKKDDDNDKEEKNKDDEIKRKKLIKIF